MSERRERGSRGPARQAPLGQPGAHIPRWLALVVLIALLASAAWSTWRILAPAGGGSPPPAAASD